jgi:cation diffusion facilitator CzcD-associated flavoprotein CzcO
MVTKSEKQSIPTSFVSPEATISQNTVHCHTIIVGAGPAGLAVGACLKQAGIPAVILEQDNKIGPAWHRHYERLHLHTDKAHSALPYAPLPKDYPRYPSRLQLIDYLEAYARQFELEPRFGQQVVAARPSNGSWEVQTQDTRYQATNLVIATGYNREPYCPSWPGQGSFASPILHSSQYRNGEAFKDQRVLVIGFGNSGGEIAIDLWEYGAKPAISVRSPVNVIPRELFGIPVLTIVILQRKLPPRLADALNAPLLQLTVGDLSQYGLRRSNDGPLTRIQRERRIPLIDVGTIQLIKRGQVTVYPGVERFTEKGVVFTDGQQEDFDAIILATGYRPRVNAFLEEVSAAYDESGMPLLSGQKIPVQGLYFCGFYVSPTGMLREIAIEARKISSAIARTL